VILPARGHDRMECFTDQMKWTRALIQNLDKAITESSQKITKREALCKKLREDTQRLEEEKANLEEMVESRDELLMEITREMGLDHKGEDEDEEEEEEDADDRGDVAAPPAAEPPPPVPSTAVPEEIDKEGPVTVILEKKPRCRMWLS
jgi:chromosome segregation ATPase